MEEKRVLIEGKKRERERGNCNNGDQPQLGNALDFGSGGKWFESESSHKI